MQLMSFLSLGSFFSWRQQGSDRLLYHRLCMLVASCRLKFLLVCLYQSCLHPRNRILTRERLFLGVPVPGTEPRMEEELPECC